MVLISGRSNLVGRYTFNTKIICYTDGKKTSNERSYFENPVTFFRPLALKSTTDSIYLLLELPSLKLDTATAREGGTGTWVWGNSTSLEVGLRICQGLTRGRQLPILLVMWKGGGGGGMV
jgi:hypothetical protein